MATLRLQRQGELPTEVTKDRALVGREASCDVVVSDKSVSRRHAVIERRGDAWAVVDQGSANGTFLDGRPVSDAPLRDGQELRFGMVALRVEIEVAMPQTVLMPQGDFDQPATMLMPGPSAAPPVAPPRVAMPAPPPLAPQRRPEPPAPPSPTRPLSPKEEAAAFLGLPIGAPASAVAARFEEISADLDARIRTAPTPALKERYQKNVEELRKACETLSPGFGAPSLEDLPAAQPSVGPGDMDVSIPAPLRSAAVPIAETPQGKSGGPPMATTVLGATAATVFALSAFFCMSGVKIQKNLTARQKSTDYTQALAAAEQYAPMDTLEKAGALVNGQLKVCSKASQPLTVLWFGAVYLDVSPTSGERRVKTYNSDFCKGEFLLSLPPQSETVVQFKGAAERCNWDGRGLFFALRMADPRAADRFLFASGTLNKREDCVSIGAGL